MHTIVISQLDCAYTVNNLEKHLSCLNLLHIQTLKYTMQFIKCTLFYQRIEEDQPRNFAAW
uniref:Uncharacterized protein n=1 Tax=Physcomitrium patens TaxID=3218 RepID=A0A2K1JNT9_PHYPA|nr:hypothetical protein PHYPA_017798 [Physcomitrium patens]